MSQLFPPSNQFQKASLLPPDDYTRLVEQANRDPESFWADRAKETLDWITPYTTVLNDTRAPFYRWFEGGKLNASTHCLDRHIASRGDQQALIWEGESGEVRTYTYRELLREVCQCANMLTTKLGVKQGDRVVLYLPMIPEAIIAMLACARIGAVHVVVFGGFSATVLRERILDTEASLVITADGASRHGKSYVLKTTVDEALEGLPQQPPVLVVAHNHETIPYIAGRDYKYRELIATQPTDCTPAIIDSEDPLFILHTSGSTGKPKGIQHSTAGYLLWAQWTTRHVFDIHDGDVYWCTADIGWITGHTYVTYGPLGIGGTVLLYEGTPMYPDAGRWWSMIEKHHVTQLYTAPTAIRLLHKNGPDEPSRYDLSSLRVLGTVGEPIDPEAWQWYHTAVGGGRCPIVDTWWQTENGGHLIAPIPGAVAVKPGSATLPLPGISVEILNEDGTTTPNGQKGLLCVTKPWPSMLRTVWGAPDRYVETYFGTVTKNGTPVYFSGDGAYRDENGYIVITGRVDDVINVSGHRVGTAEVESIVAKHPTVAECSVVSQPDELRGEKIIAFIVQKSADTPDDKPVVLKEINALLKQELSAMVHVSDIVYVPGLPKTRSGKILRRILRSIARHEALTADISTLEDPDIVGKIQHSMSI